jgi:predicted ester cyclase
MVLRRRGERSERRSVGRAAALAVVAIGAAGIAAGALWRMRRASSRPETSDPAANNASGSRRILEEIFGAGRYEVADELVAAEARGHDPALPGPVLGPEGVKEAARGYRRAFPDLKVTVEQVIPNGDHVATRWTARGTHLGELFGIAPTGKETTVTGISIDRWANGKIAESWVNWNTLGLLQQLGAVPAELQTA